MPIHYKRRLVGPKHKLYREYLYPTDTRRIIPLVTPFVLVLLGDADHERAGGNFKYLIVI